MRKIMILTFVTFILIVSGCINGTGTSTNSYKLSDVYAENPNIDFGENTRIFFEVSNNAEITLVPKIVVKVNETCFRTPNAHELENIPPKKSVRSYIYIYTSTGRYDADRERCVGKAFPVTLFLEDINGKKLDEKSIELGIV